VLFRSESERGAIFDAQAANLRDQGIDLKDLIAADQARHLALNSDATLKSNLAMQDSTMQTNALERIGLNTKNQSEQKIFDHLGVVQGQEDADAALRIRLGDSNIATNAAQAASAAASANNSNDAINERGLARLEKTKLDEDTTLLLKLSQDPKYANADGTANMGMLTKDLQAAGVPLKNIVAGMGGVDVLGRREELKATASLQAANKEKRDFAAVEQALADASKGRADSRDALKAAQDTDTNWFTGNFGQDNEKVAGDAAISGAFATIVKDPSGKDVSFSPSDISRWAAEHSDKGDLRVNEFNTRLKMEATAINTGVPVEDAVDKIKKSLTSEDMLRKLSKN
jgi:hypothetical protein